MGYHIQIKSEIPHSLVISETHIKFAVRSDEAHKIAVFLRDELQSLWPYDDKLMLEVQEVQDEITPENAGVL